MQKSPSMWKFHCQHTCLKIQDKTGGKKKRKKPFLKTGPISDFLLQKDDILCYQTMAWVQVFHLDNFRLATQSETSGCEPRTSWPELGIYYPSELLFSSVCGELFSCTERIRIVQHSLMCSAICSSMKPLDYFKYLDLSTKQWCHLLHIKFHCPAQLLSRFKVGGLPFQSFCPIWQSSALIDTVIDLFTLMERKELHLYHETNEAVLIHLSIHLPCICLKNKEHQQTETQEIPRRRERNRRFADTIIILLLPMPLPHSQITAFVILPACLLRTVK